MSSTCRLSPVLIFLSCRVLPDGSATSSDYRVAYIVGIMTFDSVLHVANFFFSSPLQIPFIGLFIAFTPALLLDSTQFSTPKLL